MYCTRLRLTMPLTLSAIQLYASCHDTRSLLSSSIATQPCVLPISCFRVSRSQTLHHDSLHEFPAPHTMNIGNRQLPRKQPDKNNPLFRLCSKIFPICNAVKNSILPLRDLKIHCRHVLPEAKGAYRMNQGGGESLLLYVGKSVSNAARDVIQHY